MKIILATLFLAYVVLVSAHDDEYRVFRDSCIINSTCSNGAYCKNFNSTSYSCACLPGWTGASCDTQIDYCSPNPCKNGFSCIKVGYLDYKCSCTQCSDFAGRNCELINSCKSSPCQNGGFCTNTNTSYVCKCPPGFNGTNCENALDYCAPNPCVNGGVCQKWGYFDYRCNCQANYTGKNCERINYCYPDKCKNGGICENARSSYMCRCPRWFSGINCETLRNPCLMNDCRNGATCVSCYNNTNCSLYQNYQCICVSPYVGATCQGFKTQADCLASGCRKRCYAMRSDGFYYCM